MTTGAHHTCHPLPLAEAVVHVRGEMDYGLASELLRASLLAALARVPSGSNLVIDLRNSSFCDSSGLNVLLAVRLRALKRGIHLVLAAPSHQMIRLLEFTESDDLFTYATAPAD
ncbi:STAS domain-containing protein [Streptomyces sp. NPDC056944]|uniref:STAS domain-containing protein n=1 Tax=Streptomyces sp. NPDC056944 TaxID=3345972 RepID=UPI00363AD663